MSSVIEISAEGSKVREIKNIKGGGYKSYCKTRWTTACECIERILRLEQVLKEAKSLPLANIAGVLFDYRAFVLQYSVYNPVLVFTALVMWLQLFDILNSNH
ncbi:hypothetical protein Glove_109g322 [Diversispora epigaea]|uniref:Uncharacterized protein n=1 Tax=Diversispora epigaea TaxID=1348612 RepID=A0A397J1Y8_9GLOM|nr:hypothetical protein Glove_109g322 [Diversispora epigaea]